MQEFQEWISRFLIFRASEGLAYTTRANDRQSLSRLVAWVSSLGLTWPDLTPERMGIYIDRIRARWVKGGSGQCRLASASTVMAEVGSLRLFFRYLVEQEILLFNPLDRIHLERPKVICGRGVFNRAEIQRIFEAVTGDTVFDQRERAIFAILYGAGLRRSEVLDLDLSDYNPDERILWIRQGKGDKDRLVPLSEKACEDLGVFPASVRELCAPYGYAMAFRTSNREKGGTPMVQRSTGDRLVLAEIERIRQRIEEWRSTRDKMGPMPEDLWRRAIELARTHGISPVSRALKIDYTSLKQRLASQAEGSPTQFVEVTLPHSGWPTQTSVDIDRPDGARMKIWVVGQTDLVRDLASRFLGAA